MIATFHFHSHVARLTEIVMRVPATPIFKSLIIKITDGKSLSSTVLVVAGVPAVALVSKFMDPTGADAGVGAGAGASLPPCSQEGVSAMALWFIAELVSRKCRCCGWGVL